MRPLSTTGRLELRAVAGYSGFIDESTMDHAAVGGAVRWLVTPRLGAEAEVLYMRGPGADRDWTVMPSISWDLRSRGTVVPYVIWGVGWLRTTQSTGTGLYSSWSMTLAAGGGVRVAVSPVTALVLEARLGTEPFSRVTAALAWRPGGSTPHP